MMPFQVGIAMHAQTCIACGILFALPKDYDDQLRATRAAFYCPNGHPMHYIGDSSPPIAAPRGTLVEDNQTAAEWIASKLP